MKFHLKMLSKAKIFFCFIVIFVLVKNSKALEGGKTGEGSLVETTYGTLRGETRKVLLEENGANRNETTTVSVDLCLGVPFARPPIGELRFEKPKPPERWEGIREARSEPPPCVPNVRPDKAPSVQKMFSEDCLYMNIIAPHQKQHENKTKHPVLVLIHGGFFSIGSAQAYNNFDDIARKYVARGIVVVAIQYRLGFLGFTSLGDDDGGEMPGNLGLWDQLAALRFINANVEAFGGDPFQVTLWGYSAGAVSVGAHLVSPHSQQGLFQRAVQMSGSLMSAKTQGRLVADDTREWAEKLGCYPPPSRNHTENGTTSLSVKNCLRTKSIDEMMDAVEAAGPIRLDVNFVKFQPRFDGDFFPEPYVKLFQEAPPKHTLAGFNDLEALPYTVLAPGHRNSSTSSFAVSPDDFERFDHVRFAHFVRAVIAKDEFYGGDKEEADEVAREIVAFFEGYQGVGQREKDASFFLRIYTELLSDLFYVLPMLWEHMLKAQANAGWKIWLYEHRHYNPVLFPPQLPSSIRGSFHLNDARYLFPPANQNKRFVFDAEDRANERWFSDVLANFVLTGKPYAKNTLLKVRPNLRSPSESESESEELLLHGRWLSADAARPLRHVSVQWRGNESSVPTLDDAFRGPLLARLEFWHRLLEAHPRWNLVSGTPSSSSVSEVKKSEKKKKNAKNAGKQGGGGTADEL